MSADQESPSGQRPKSLADVLSEVARLLQTEPDLDRTLVRIVAAAVDTVPGAQHAAVSLVESDQLRTVAASNKIAERMDELERQFQEGPCFDAIQQHRTYRVADLAEESRWPKFAPAARELGVVSMLGFRLFTHGNTFGALNLYSEQRDAFDTEAEHIGDLFAAHAAVALAGAHEAAHLQLALSSRDVIAMAKGILIERHDATPERAFELLVEASQHANIKLIDVARWLVQNPRRRKRSR